MLCFKTIVRVLIQYYFFYWAPLSSPDSELKLQRRK